MNKCSCNYDPIYRIHTKCDYHKIQSLKESNKFLKNEIERLNTILLGNEWNINLIERRMNNIGIISQNNY
jgi:hypothetical protein